METKSNRIEELSIQISSLEAQKITLGVQISSDIKRITSNLPHSVESMKKIAELEQKIKENSQKKSPEVTNSVISEMVSYKTLEEKIKKIREQIQRLIRSCPEFHSSPVCGCEIGGKRRLA